MHLPLSRLIARLLRHHQLSPAHARIVAHAISDAESRGITSHGVRRLPNYVARLRAGAINAHPQLRWSQLRPATLMLAADHAFGQLASHYAVPRLIRRTRRYGIAAVGIMQCEHVGALDTPLRTIVAANLAAIIMCNTPVAMAPIGGKTALLGSNPIAIGIPGADTPLMVFDGATSSVARSKIVAAAEHNHDIPNTWAIDAHGNPTSDAHAALAGALLPAGTLGYGIGLAVALLTGAMLGGVSDDQLPSFLQAPHQPVATSMLMIGIDPAAFGGHQQLQQVGGALVAKIRTSHGQPRIPGDARQVRAIRAETLAYVRALLSDSFHQR